MNLLIFSKVMMEKSAVYLAKVVWPPLTVANEARFGFWVPRMH